MYMKKLGSILLPASTLILASLLLSGCSVGMALNGEETPDLTVVKQGVTKTEMDIHFGSPIKTEPLKDGSKRCIYAYKVGSESSAGRAVGHGVMDVLTLGLWEVAGTPIEGFSGDSYQLAVVFDKNDKAIDMKRSEKNQSL